MRPYLSIIVPVYNCEAYLNKCMDSLLGQTLQHIEILAIDDCSTDNSLEVLKDYANCDSRVKVFTTVINSGQGAARNVGLRNVTGEYFGFLDADDFYESNMCEHMYQKAVSGDFDCVSCGLKAFVDLDGNIVFQKKAQVSPDNSDEFLDLVLNPHVQPPIHIFKSSMLTRESGLLFPETRGSEDISFYFKAICCCQSFAHVNENLVCRRLRNDSTAQTVSVKACENFFSVSKDCLAFIKEHETSRSEFEAVRAALTRLLFCSRLGLIGLIENKSERDDLLRQVQDFIKANLDRRNIRKFYKGLVGVYLRCFPLSCLGIASGFFSIRQRQFFKKPDQLFLKKLNGYLFAKTQQLLHQKVFSSRGNTYNYLLYPGKGTDRKTLVVVFSSCTRSGIPARYNYVRTLKDSNYTRLFILDDKGPGRRGDYYLGNYENIFESFDSLIELIDEVKGRLEINRSVYCGSSKGGWASLYYGLRDPGATVIAGAPQIYLGKYLLSEYEKPDGNHDLLPYMAGSPGNIEILTLLDNLIPKAINNLESPSDVTIYLNFSSLEHTFNDHIKDLINMFKSKGVKYELKVDSYTNHSDISKHFPKFLLKTLNEMD